MDVAQKYEALRGSGNTPLEIYLVAKQDGLNKAARIKLLRLLFNLSLSEAKEVTIRARTDGDTLSEYQARLILPLEKALENAENEGE